MRVVIASAACASGQGMPRNIGDEALTDALAGVLQRAGNDVVASLGGQWSDTPTTDSGIERVPLRGIGELRAAFAGADHVVIGGGTLLAENEAPQYGLIPRGLIRYVLAVSGVAATMRIPYSFVGVGAEKWPSRGATLLKRTVNRAHMVAVRDADSAALVHEKTGVSPTLSGDAFYGWVPERGSRPGNQTVVALSGRTTAPQIEQVIDQVLRSGRRNVAIVRMDQEGDDELVSRTLAERLTAQHVSVELTPLVRDWRDVYTTIADAELVVASRLHALIMASRAGVPSVAIGENKKVRTFVADSGIAHIDSGFDPRSARTDYILRQQELLEDACARIS